MKTQENDFCRYDPVIWLVVMVGALILGLQLYFSSFGFDFTDESYYLNCFNAQSPIRDRQFGYFYRPLWLFVGKDVALFRQANILFTMFMTFLLSLLLLREIEDKNTRASTLLTKARFWGLAFGLSSIGNLVFFWFFTPSYNTLTFQALVVAAMGLLLLDRSSSLRSLAGWALLGMGGWMTFMAKPTTAVGLAVLALAYLFIVRMARPVLIGFAIGVALLLLIAFAFIVDGSPLLFISRTRAGYQDVVFADPIYRNWLWHHNLVLSNQEWRIIALIFILACIGTIASTSYWGRMNKVVRLGWLMLLIIAVASSVAIGFDLISCRITGIFRALPMLGLSLGALFGALFVWHRRFTIKLNIRVLCGIIIFLLLPYVFALGTSNDYWRQMQGAGFFWVCAAILVLTRAVDKKSGWRACLMVVALAQVIMINSIALSIELPYRQPESFRKSRELINLHPRGAPIQVCKESCDYIRALREHSTQKGFEPGMPLLDLTGHSPGAIFVLGAKPVGEPWMWFSKYPTAAAIAEKRLDRVPTDEIRRAWVLVEPEGRRALPESLLERYGLSLKDNYELVTTLAAPRRGGSRNPTQHLYKPKHEIELVGQ